MPGRSLGAWIMDQIADPMVHRRRLRTQLKEARLRLGLTQMQVAADLGWSASKLLRVENGKVGVSRTDLKALLNCYGITDERETAELVRMAEQGRKQRWSAYRDVLNPEFFRYLEYEGSANVIRQFQPHFIPGLLQTESYTRALNLVTAPHTPSHTLDRQMEVRAHRRRMLEEPHSARLHVLLDESAVRRWDWSEPATAAIMHEQFAHLKTLALLPSIIIQVIPFKAGPYRGMTSSFILLSFPDADDNDLLFRESGSDSVTSQNDVRKSAEVASLFEDLTAIATPPTALGDFLHRIADEEARS